ncbi:MAG: hypothetical protein HKN78_01615 [Sphingomonadaceae bacterium]|nr:hypothetical protein [Sphingomonadaceae bacterium]
MFWAGAASAHVSCNATNQFTFAFASQTAQTLSYAGTYNYTATNGLAQSVNVQVSFQTFGVFSSVVAGRQMPEISTLVSGAPTAQSLVLGAIFTGRTPNIALNNRVVVTTFTFAQPIRELRMNWHDIDFSSNQFRDYVQVLGRNGASTYTATLTSPAGNNNTGGPVTAAGSSLSFGPAVTPTVLTVDQAAGISSSGNNANTGNIDVLFDEPVTSVEWRYGNAPLTGTETNTGQQAVGITAISFCPMPNINVAKSSAPFDTSGPKRFNIPNTDVVYTLSVRNNGGSTVDANEIDLSDILPADVTFFNGDFNGAAAGTDNFEFVPGSSGLSLTAGDVTYSNNGGSTYAYSPSAGYDGNVDAVRFEPTGTFAANSSFTIRFRARIN